MTTLLSSTFNCMQREATSVIESCSVTDCPQSHTEAPNNIEQDDDMSLLRLGGWALFSTIKYRELAVKQTSKTKHTTAKL